jgi:GPH family glycoside/pentoside/hexuronide:cation symporter
MERKKLPVGIKFGYGAGEFGPDLFFIAAAMVLLYFLTDVVGLAAGLAGTAIMIGRIWDAFYDPIIGHLSDRTVAAMGRRRPYIMGGGIVFAIAMVFLFTNPTLLFGAGISQTTLFLYAMITYIIICTAYSTEFIPYASLAPELTTDYHERTSLMSFRFGFGIIATLLGAGLALPIVGLCQDKSVGFVLMGGIFGAAVLISALVTVLAIKEPVHVKAASSMGFFESFVSVFKNKPYVLILATYVLNMLGVTLVSAAVIYYFKYILNAESMVTAAMVILLVTAFLFVPVNNAMSKKVGKKIPYGMGLLIMAAALLVLFFLGATMGTTFCLVVAFFIGVGQGFTYASPYTIVADALEYDYLLTGQRREGAFFGVWSWFSKIAQALAIFLMGLTLQFMGYVPNVIPQTPSAALGIELFMGPINALLFVIAAIILYFYPITQKRYQEILAQIAERDAKLASK